MKKVILFLFGIYSLFFVVGSSLAPIMAHFGHYEISAKLTEIFMYSCHQQPDRTFWLLGYPMALCCRCFGFYLGVTIFSLLSIFDKFKYKTKLFYFLIVISITDISLNLVLKINTGDYTRFFIGIIMGYLFITILIKLIKFFTTEKGEQNENQKSN